MKQGDPSVVRQLGDRAVQVLWQIQARQACSSTLSVQLRNVHCSVLHEIHNIR
jgi:hypothetical protein